MCKECLQTPQGAKVRQAVTLAEQACKGLGTTSIDAFIAKYGRDYYTGRSKELLEGANAARIALWQLHAECRNEVAQAETALKTRGFRVKREQHYTWRITSLEGGLSTHMSCHQVKQLAATIAYPVQTGQQDQWNEDRELVQAQLWNDGTIEGGF